MPYVFTSNAILDAPAASSSDFAFNYPLLGTYYLSPTQWGNNTIRDWIGARFANVVFTKWNGAEATAGLSCKAAMDDMLANVPAGMGGTPVYTIYILNNEVTKDTGDSATTFVRTRCAAENQYLYSGAVGGTVVDSNFDPPNNYAINNTSGGLAGSDGKTLIQWYAETKYTHNVVGDGNNSANSTVHGHYLDNIFWIPRTGDANYDAIGSSNETASAAASSQRQGLANHYSYEATIWPSARVRFGNVDDLSGSNISTLYNTSFTPDLSAISPLSQVIDGGVGGEYWLGSAFSKETQEAGNSPASKSTDVLRNHARFTDAAVKYPQLLIYSSREITNANTSGNWQKFRFGLGACLVFTNGAFDDTLAADTTWDPDEYTNAGAGIGWLGRPVDSQQYSASIAQGSVGVYVRRFTNGYVVVNPRNNGSQTITLPYSGTRINGRSGKSDLSVNDGSSVTGGVSTWSAADRDAILIRY